MEPQTYTLLLADDNPANLDVLSKILREQGYRVRTALNGELALESIRAAAPDMALLDIHMPVMDGYELCKQMKSDPHIAHIPVMFVSGIGESFNKVIAFELGAVDYISKPVDPAEVVARVNTHLKMLELQRSLIRQNADLEDRVLARTTELHCALEELKELHQRLDALDKAKNDFLRLISHELRTPMVGLELFDDLIKRDQIPDGELANYRNMFWASHRKLVNIVDHATILTQINLQSLSPRASEGHRVRGLILQATAPLLPLAKTQDVSLNLQEDEGFDLFCDPDLLVTAFNALVETAIKFASRGAEVRVGWIEGNAGRSLWIESDGATIPDDVHGIFFEVMAIEQALFPGGDLGLAPAVAKQILSALGVPVCVANRENSGIRLTVDFGKPCGESQ